MGGVGGRGGRGQTEKERGLWRGTEGSGGSRERGGREGGRGGKKGWRVGEKEGKGEEGGVGERERGRKGEGGRERDVRRWSCLPLHQLTSLTRCPLALPIPTVLHQENIEPTVPVQSLSIM